MSDPAVKQRLRRAKARAAHILRDEGFDVFPLASPECHFLVRKKNTKQLCAIKVDIVMNGGVHLSPIRPIGVDKFQVWAFGRNRSEYQIIDIS